MKANLLVSANTWAFIMTNVGLAFFPHSLTIPLHFHLPFAEGEFKVPIEIAEKAVIL